MYTTSCRIRNGSSRLFEESNDDYSRIHTATRSNCSFLCIFIRQVARLVKQGNSSQGSCRPNTPHVRNLDWGFRFGHISSIFLSTDRRTRRGTDFAGWGSSTTQLKNPSGMLKNSVTCSPDSTFCLGTSPRVVIWFSGRCPVLQINWRQTSWSTHFRCSCTFRGTVSRCPHWEPCSRRHPRTQNIRFPYQ